MGPYKVWHHEHNLEQIDGGVFMTDIISYQPPFGWIGRLANTLIIRKKLHSIFDYRTLALEEIFGKYKKSD